MLVCMCACARGLEVHEGGISHDFRQVQALAEQFQKSDSCPSLDRVTSPARAKAPTQTRQFIITIHGPGTTTSSDSDPNNAYSWFPSNERPAGVFHAEHHSLFKPLSSDTD